VTVPPDKVMPRSEAEAKEVFVVSDALHEQAKEREIRLPANQRRITIGSGDGVDIHLPGGLRHGIAPTHVILIRKSLTGTPRGNSAATTAGHYDLLNIGGGKVTLRGAGKPRDIWNGSAPVVPGDLIQVSNYTIAIPSPRPTAASAIPPKTTDEKTKILEPAKTEPLVSKNFKIWFDPQPEEKLLTDEPLYVRVAIENTGPSDGAKFRPTVVVSPPGAVVPRSEPTIRTGQQGHYEFEVRHMKGPEQREGDATLHVDVSAPDDYGAEMISLPLAYKVAPYYAHEVTFDCPKDAVEGESAS
jgi:hypothetical protein